jgi:glucose-6-phosphate dehydrogenase assembly protein OpcA
MAETYKNLGQAAPSATTETTLYTVPSSTSAIGSSIIVCNRAATADTFRVSVAVGGGATANKDYLYYDVAIPANDTFIATIGVTLATTDVVRVFAGTANLSFSLWGTQIT